jgi:hypothetical protein
MNDDYDLEDTTYLPKRKPDKPITANDYISFLVEPYEKYLNWTNDTYFQDRQALYTLSHQLAKRKSDSQLKSLLDWVKEMDSKHKPLHIKQLLSTLKKNL